MQKSYQQNQYGNQKYQTKSRQNYKVKEIVSNDRSSPLAYARFQPQKTIKGHRQLKSSSGFIGINTLVSPTRSVYERKIRQAIQMRYKKSKISNYKYVKIQEKNYQKNQRENSQSSNSRQSSQLSEQMQEMRHIACLINVAYVNIHQFHSKKSAPLKQTSKEKDRNRKRRFKIPLSFGRQNLNDKQTQYHGNHDKQKQQLMNKQTNSNVNNLNHKKLQQSRTLNCKEASQINDLSQEKQKKFLSSRLPYQRDPIELKKSQFEKSSNLSPSAQYSSQNKIKDTFKLKYPNKILNKNVQNIVDQQKLRKEQQQNQRSSSKTATKTRRFLLHKNQKMQNIKTQPNQVSQLSHRIKNQNRDSSYQKIASLRKIQTQFIETVSNQQQIYNKTTKNKAKMIKNYRNNNFLMNRINENSQKSLSSASQQKWKLQQISFKFKPVHQFQRDSRNNQIQKMQDNKNQALKLGLSLQKAYSKLLENKKKKMQKKQETSARTNYISEEKKKRRMLRISPRNDKSLIINGQMESQLIKKDQSINFCSAILIENRSQESLSGQRRQSRKYKFLKNSKGQRFSTIQ